MNSSQTKQYMYRALELAKKGTGAVNPNPLVGAVLVKDNRIIGEGIMKNTDSCTQNAMR